MKLSKEKERVTTVHKKKDGKIHKQLKDIKNKKPGATAKTAGRVAVTTVASSVDGGENIEDALVAADTIIRPVKDTVDVGNRIRKKISSAESINKEINSGIRKKADARGKQLAKDKVSKTSKDKARGMTIRKVNNVSKSAGKKVTKNAAKKSSKKAVKEVSKEAAKLTAKTTAQVGTTAAGATTGPYGLLVGYAAGQVAGEVIDKVDYKNTQRMRKFKYMLDKLNPQSKQNDNLFKLAKDTVKNYVMYTGRKVLKMMLPLVLPILVLVVSIGAIILGVITVLYNSPLAIFLPPLGPGDTVRSVTTQYMSEFNQEILNLAQEHQQASAARIIYPDYEGMSTAPSNYYDIMCVYMVKYGFETSAAQMTDNNKRNLKTVFNNMCSYTTELVDEERVTSPTDNASTSEEPEGGQEQEATAEVEGAMDTGSTSTTQRFLDIKVTLKTYDQMISEYDFDANQTELLTQMMKQFASVGSSTQGGTSLSNLQSSLSAEEIKTISDKVTDPTRKKVVEFALSKVGFPYSQALRNSGGAYDCSSLAYYAWQSAGVDISYMGYTYAAAEAAGLAEKQVTNGELQPGDLVFYSYTQNGRYKNISHVGIYIGDGKMVEAVDDAHGVCLGDYHGGSVVMVCRPGVKR